MPDILTMVAVTATVTQFIKGAILSLFKYTVEGILAQVLAAVTAFGVVGYFFFKAGIPFDFVGFLILAAQVAFYAIIGYKTVKAASTVKPKPTY